MNEGKGPMGERRLGAIMFTDVVGYSAITSQDEGRALRLLDEHRKILQVVFPKYGGTVVKTMGDGYLVEFASAVEAVNCAVEAQGELKKSNQNRPAADRILVRIGIHVGDVVHSAGDVLGDAVNVAARLQPLADPGGICVTRQVVDQVERKVGVRFVKTGPRELKNIRYPVELYKVESIKGESPAEEGGLDPRRVAILPFANMSADPNDKYFADGLTEELISTVSRIGELSVISRTSVMRYKDTTVPICEIGRELASGTVLEGSVRKAGNRVRVTTQLIDARSDKHLWAQSYDRDLTDIFAIQGDIAEQVAEALRVKLVSEEKEAVEKKATGNLEAYTLYLRGRQAWNERSKEGLARAMDFFKRAVELDPEFALAYTGLADCYTIMEDRAMMPHKEAIPLARGYAEKAVGFDGDLAEGHASLGLILEKEWDLAGAQAEFRMALTLKPSYATAQHWYSSLLGSLGDHEGAFAAAKRALELDPLSSTVGQGVGVALLNLGRYDEAVGEFEKVLETDPDYVSAHFWKAWALYQRGDLGQAIEEAQKGVEKDSSSFIASMALAWLQVKAGRREPAQRLLEDARKAEGYVSPAAIAILKLGLGEKDEAYELLESAFEAHDGFLGYFREFPWLAEYRKDSRWVEIERKMDAPGA
jgi:adenylate cyclase